LNLPPTDRKALNDEFELPTIISTKERITITESKQFILSRKYPNNLFASIFNAISIATKLILVVKIINYQK